MRGPSGPSGNVQGGYIIQCRPIIPSERVSREARQVMYRWSI